MAEQKPRVLIVDDERVNLNILYELLHADYQIMAANTSEKALQAVLSKVPPDLVLLDVVMPDMDGYSVCQQLKSNELTEDIPVIFITARDEASDETRGLELGAVDYITKPFNSAVVKARIATQLKLSKAMQELERMYDLALDANPLTGLPGNTSIANRINKALDNGQDVSVIYADIDNFKAFNDKYGFANGDKAISLTVDIIDTAMRNLNIRKAFVGHIGGDDFVIVVPTRSVEFIAEEIIKLFDKRIRELYSAEDLAALFIAAVDRQGRPQRYPLMTISLACVDLSNGKFQRFAEVNDACVEVKKKAKAGVGSNFFMNRRG